ncbi:DUF3611 family protein [uncultured Thiodictyon sp.]|uniref:DUF3611 family protein n=1 Tax=uncultured Thiodictyon sp. TaxID=1846217 RepID=UPI0025E6610A|nr:DUF3611 family protein [uncultured Thiodictyon sp.]
MSMLKQIVEGLHGAKIEGLAKTFTRLGRIGFWLQVVLGAIPLAIMFYVFVFSGSISGPRSALPSVGLLSLANMLVLLFTIVWFHRYTGLGRRIADAQSRPTESAVLATVWTGLIASSLGILFSMVVMLLEVGQLLFYFLSAPQAGIATIQTTGGASASWVSAVDLVSLLALLQMLAAEVIALVLGLWLMFRTTQAAGEFPKAA